MPPLPHISGDEARRAFERAGYVFDRQDGSHMVLVKDGEAGTISVPRHRELNVGTLRGIIRSSGLTVDEFLVLLKSRRSPKNP